MSDFGKLEARFWQRGTGKRLRGDKDAQIVAVYLMSCESARPLGVFYLPWALLTSETGLDDAEVVAALARLEEEGFAFYDRDEELAWLPGMAVRRVGEGISAGDRRKAGLLKDFQALPPHRYRDELADMHSARFGLPALKKSAANQGPSRVPARSFEGPSKVPTRPVEGPSKVIAAFASVEGEGEREQKQEREGEAEEDAPASPDQECALATHTPPPIRVLEDPAAVAVLERLRSHRDLAAIATPAYAERIAGLVMAGKPLAWVLGAVDELADAKMAADNGPSPWNDEVLGRKLITFSKAARRPRDEPVGDMTAEQVTAEQRRRKVQVGATDWSKQADVSVETEVV